MIRKSTATLLLCFVLFNNQPAHSQDDGFTSYKKMRGAFDESFDNRSVQLNQAVNDQNSLTPAPPAVINQPTPAPQSKLSLKGAIDAAMKSLHDDDKETILEQIINNLRLSPADQFYLVEALQAQPLQEDSTVALLKALLSKPTIATATKQAIIDNMTQFKLSAYSQSKLIQVLQNPDVSDDPSAVDPDFEDLARDLKSMAYNLNTVHFNIKPEDLGPWLGPIMGALGVFSVFFMLLFFIPKIFFLLTLSKCLQKIKEKNRMLPTGLVWLGLIPFFSIFWNFYLVIKIKDSLTAEFKENGLERADDDYGYKMGMIMSVLSASSLVPFIGMLTAWVSPIFWIIYWVQIAEYSRRLSAGLGSR